MKNTENHEKGSLRTGTTVIDKKMNFNKEKIIVHF